MVDPNAANLHLLALATSSTYYGYYWDNCAATTAGGIRPTAAAIRTIWYTYEYTVGSLLIGMTDHRAMTNNKAPLIWFAGMNGLVDQTSLPEIYADRPGIQPVPCIHHP